MDIREIYLCKLSNEGCESRYNGQADILKAKNFLKRRPKSEVIFLLSMGKRNYKKDLEVKLRVQLETLIAS